MVTQIDAEASLRAYASIGVDMAETYMARMEVERMAVKEEADKKKVGLERITKQVEGDRMGRTNGAKKESSKKEAGQNEWQGEVMAAAERMIGAVK